MLRCCIRDCSNKAVEFYAYSLGGYFLLCTTCSRILLGPKRLGKVPKTKLKLHDLQTVTEDTVQIAWVMES